VRALVDGAMPTALIAALMDLDDVAMDQSGVAFRGRPGDRHLNPICNVHGGFAVTLLDYALGGALHSTPTPGVGYRIVDL